MRHINGFLPLIAIVAVSTWAMPLANAGPITNFFLDGVEDKAENVMAKARAEGNALAWGVADAAKSVIDAWKDANKELLDDAFDGLEEQQRRLFNNMNETLTRLEDDQTILVRNAERLTAEWSGVIKDIPFVDHDPEVMNYRPRVITPVGEGEVPLVVVGPKLGGASPAMEIGEEEIAVGSSTDNELLARVLRKNLVFDETASKFMEHKLTFDRTVTVWYKPWTWGAKERVERQISIWLLPKQMASFEIVPTLPDELSTPGVYSTQVGGRGKDAPYPVAVPLAPIWIEQGYVYDTLAIAQNQFFSNAGGDNASCTGAKVDTITPKSFDFYMQMGHRSRGRDGWVNCNLAIPLVKKVPSTKKGNPITGILNWTDDSLQTLPDKTQGYTVTLKMFDGRSYVLTNETSDPTGVVEIEKTDTTIRFRPKPPRDF
jgi:hypothetical protein